MEHKTNSYPNIAERTLGANAFLAFKEEGLESVIEETLQNSKENYLPHIPHIKMATSELDVLNAFFLRSIVYYEEGYASHFSRINKGIEFDKFDKNSIQFLYHLQDKTPISTFRIAMDDDELGLPSEKYCPEISKIKEKNKKIAEVSRMVIHPLYQKSYAVLFSDLGACYEFGISNNIDSFVFGASSSVTDMYENKLAHMNTIKDNVSYGNVSDPLNFREWEVSNTYRKFLKHFNSLKKKNE